MMEAIHSPHWYRVAGLHPRLRRHVRVQRRPSRGTLWFVLQDGASGRHHRLNESAWRLAGRFDGQASVQQIWESLRALHGEAAPTQPDVVALLMQLDAAGLIQCERTPDVAALLRRGEDRRRTARRRAANPLAFRVPIADPSACLRPLAGLGRMLVGTPVLLLWLLAVGTAAVAAAMHWPELRSHAGLHMPTPRHLLMAWVCYPLVKAVHELAHALVVRAHGGEVHEVGITLLFFVPVPYVDASASNGFALRRHRMGVAAAGIMAELLLAAAALGVWLATEEGLVRDAAFVVLVICSVSTLLFNANPLLRFDGYFMLCDALDLPNLGPRSKAYLVWLVQRFGLGLQRIAPPAVARGEAPWFVAYGLAAAAYRFAVAVLIVLWTATQSAALGLVALAWALFGLLLQPLWRGLRFLCRDPRLAQRRGRAMAASLAGAAVVVGLVGVLPLPMATRAEGVVIAPEGARVRAGTAGFVAELLVADGQRVRRGQVLMRLEDPALPAERARVAAQLVAADVTHHQALFGNPVRAQAVAAEIDRLRADLQRLDERIGLLHVRSPADGTLVVPRPRDLPRRHVPQGAMLAYVIDGQPLELRVPVSQDDIDLVRGGTRSVAVRLADAPAIARPAVTLREVPAGGQALPSAALGDRGGGAWVTDPADPEGLRTLLPLFVVDLRVPQVPVERIGGRAWVRFDHGRAPLAAQLWRRARQAFLRHADPG
ncbi:PqqD family peptide modification chaperone [Aquincola sp. MAHUQ-54]|uniref:PqqD family peptide modification chaperone n=1 Tax=Aquincola agrisoli TaxID=3119538 RepID=A0AAW9Q3Z2_9BURK